jgi:phage tail-like protein
MPGPGEHDVLISSYFTLTVDGALTAMFREISGMGSENSVVTTTSRGADGKQITTSSIGPVKYNPIVCKRGIPRSKDKSMEMWNWRKLVEQGKIDEARKNGSIVMYDTEMKPVARWELISCWPSKLTGPGPKADSNEAAIEELVLTIDGYERTE